VVRGKLISGLHDIVGVCAVDGVIMKKKKDHQGFIKASDFLFGFVIGLWVFFLAELVATRTSIYIFMAVVSLVAICLWYKQSKNHIYGVKKEEKDI